MTTPITKAADLISALKNDKTKLLFWRCGNRPAAPGAYSFGDVRVYATAVQGAEKIGALKCIRSDYQSRSYKLAFKFRMEDQP